MRTIQLREWSLAEGLHLTIPQRDALRTRLNATVQPATGSSDTFDVRPGNTIGAVVVDGAAIVITPKIEIARVLFLLGYACDPKAWREPEARLAEAPDLVSAVVGLFVDLAEQALHRGLLTGYHEVEDELLTVRGRIDLAEQLRRRPGLPIPLALRFTEYDDDILENRLLLAAATALRGLPVGQPTLRSRLRRILETLQTVNLVPFHPTAIPDVTWTRLNDHYRPAIRLATVILQHRSPDLALGQVTVPSLVLDMSVIFEDFVRTALREALAVPDSRFPDGDSCPRLTLDRRGRIRLKPDLSLWSGGRCTFVGDVKYKRDTGPGRNDDLYQLLAYATATRLPEATLVYADGPPEPRAHTIDPAGTRLVVEHLDLADPPATLLDRIRGIAAGINTSTAERLLATH